MKSAVAMAAVVILAGCGSSPGESTASSSRGASPAAGQSQSASANPLETPGSAVLFAVVEGETPTGSEAGTVAIVGLDGYARAKANFTPRQRPYVGNAAVPLQPPAQVVGSALYYIDGYGAVRALRVGAQPKLIASFSTQPVQYETWFAVSPDGATAIAGVLQYPAIGTPPSPCDGLTCMPPLVGPWSFRLASGGSPATTLQQYSSSNHPDSQSSGWHPLFPVAWIKDGPVAMIPVSIGTQNAWWGGPLYLLDGSGKQVRQLGGAGCDSDVVVGGEFIPCTSGEYGVTVRDVFGHILWTSQVEGFNALGLHLAPDGQGISDGDKVETRTGGLVTMPSGFTVEGWLDSSTVVGRVATADGQWGNLSWIRLSDPSTVHDLGFKGDFIGTIAV